MIAFVVTITLMPIGLSYVRPPDPARFIQREGWLEQGIETLTRALLRGRWWVVTGTFLVGLVAVYGALNLDVDNAVLDQLDEGDPVYKTTKLLEREFSGVRPLELRLVGGPKSFEDPAVLEAIEGLQGWIEGQEGVLTTTAWPDFLREVWFVMTGDASVRKDSFEEESRIRGLASILSRGEKDPMAPWITPNRDRARLSIQLEDVGAKATIALSERLMAVFAERFDGLGIEV
jgi:predicted RND superfamily exporter protein